MGFTGIFGPERLPSWYRSRPDGSLQHDGERPGPGWHAHGYFKKQLTLLVGLQVVERTVFKRRWRLVGTNTTRHSRPPDDLPCKSVSSVLVVLFLARCLGVELPADLPDIESCRSDRTVQRWLARAQSRAILVQQAIRHALIERCEPRPFERLFKGGLSPPQASLQGRRDPSTVCTLWQGLAMAINGATQLATPLSVLMAEARRRWNGPEDSFPI